MNFLDGLQKRAGSQGEILILPTSGSCVGRAAASEKVDKTFEDKNKFRLISGNLPLNANAYIMRDVTVRPEIVNPLDSCQRHVSTGKMAIIPSPKLRMKVYADEQETSHKILVSTGAVTHPNYRDTQRGQVAKLDHQYSAVIVEVESRQKYHFRQLNADRNGVFYDLGYRYNGSKKPEFERLEAMVLGDWHEFYNPLEVVQCTETMLGDLQPKRIFIHDLFDGDAISFFHEKDILVKARQKIEGRDRLDTALEACYKRLVWFRSVAPDTEIYVVKSNHDERLYHYVKEMKFRDDNANSGVGSRLFAEMLENGADPLLAGIAHYGGKIPRGVHFLQRTDSMKVAGWTVSAHGDKGPSGRKATTSTLSNNYSYIIAAHLHSPEIFRNVFRAGTSTGRMEYSEGCPNNWMNSHVLLPRNGHPQIVNIIDGRYRPN